MEIFGMKRPSNKDTEEDLLKFQKDFEEQMKKDPDLKSNISVELIRENERESNREQLIDPAIEEIMDQDDKSVPSLLNEVTENSDIKLPLLPQESTLPFPKAVSIDYKSLQKSAMSDGKGKKKSLFALHMEKHGKAQVVGPQVKCPIPEDPVERKIVNQNVYNSVITGEGLAGGTISTDSEIEKIHSENIK
ncbi:hypothetical protein LOD99_10411 [Oopsacas minuta]|uniref:Uncharacterized protein n=1 Tax=Oopsacas minuta TaxID=111878 RepID=A0AAV7KGM2_9METZ|nr:hypothetical protein LOD99_10411 [Oopsacas minuta]